MLEPLIRNEILLEIALSLGGENELTALLQRSLPVFMSKLNCAIASAIHQHDDQADTVIVIPRIFQRRPAYQQTVDEMIRQMRESPAAAPFTAVRNGIFYYGFVLEGFGLLVLGRTAAFDSILLQELAPVVTVLARSCVACLEYTRRVASEATLQNHRERLRRLTECLAHLGADYHSNIQRLTALAGELLDADCALYYRLEQGLAVVRGQWRIPPDEPQVVHPEKKLCCQPLSGGERFHYFQVAPESDECLPCGAKTCLSSGIFHHDRALGALCLRLPARYELSEDSRFVVDLITASLEREEALKKAQEDLAIQLRGEIGLAHFASTLIQAQENRDPLPTALQHLLDATGVDRVCLFENFTDPVDGLCCRHTYEIGNFSVQLKPRSNYIASKHFFYSNMPLFHQELSQRRTLHRIVAQLPDPEREILTLQNVASILLIPIFVQDQWRGFMGFDDTRQEREWSEQEVRLLQTAVEVYQLYLQRQDQDAVLRESEARHRDLYRLMRLLCDNVPDMIWAKDIERNYLFANQAICSQLLMAHDTSEPVGKNDLFFGERESRAHPEHPQWLLAFGAAFRESDMAVMRDGKTRHREEAGYVRGQWLVLDVIKSPLWDEEGQMIGTVGCARNVTAAKQLQKQQEIAQQQLREDENLLNLIIEAIPNPVFYKNAEGLYERCNQAYVDFLGIPKEKLIGASVYDIFPRDLADIYHRADRSLQQTREQQTYEAQMIHADQSRHDVVFYKSLIVNVDGTPRGIVGTVVDITQHKQSEIKLRRMAEIDALTQIYNRAYFYTVMEREFDRARRYHRCLSLIMLDLDHFKTVNDEYGHDVGDRVLQETAALMQSLIRKHDILVRWGGEEFVVLCVETPFSEAYSLSERLLEALRQHTFSCGKITASFGVVEYQNDESIHLLFKRLDTALYAAKAKGRNRIERLI